MKKIFIYTMLVLTCQLFAIGGSNVFNIDMTSGARGSGSVLGADIDDYASILVNPSLMPISGWNYFKVGYRDYYEDMDLSLLTGAVYFKGIGNIGVSALYGNWGYQDSRDALGNYTGEFHASDLGLVLSVADSIGGNSYAGVNIKYLHSRIDTYSAEAFLVDMGVSFKMKKLLIGLFVNNWGTKAEYDGEGAFPGISSGIAFRFRNNFKGGNMALTFLSQGVIKDNSLVLNAGLSFNITRSLALRFGSSDILNGISRLITAGAGVELGNLGAEVSYGWGIDLPGTLSVATGYRW